MNEKTKEQLHTYECWCQALSKHPEIVLDGIYFAGDGLVARAYGTVNTKEQVRIANAALDTTCQVVARWSYLGACRRASGQRWKEYDLELIESKELRQERMDAWHRKHHPSESKS